jgi:hypothetical protein
MTVVVAAGSIPLGDYQYTAILCIKNRNGDLLSSSPISEVMHITVAGTTKKHTFTFDGYFLNNIQRVNSPELFYYIQLYRTDTNGSVFYLVGEQIITTYSTPTIVDNVLYILSNATLYTTGGVLENIYPANPLNTIEANNRVWILTDDNMIWYSKPIEFGLGLQFSDVNIIDIPSVYGKAYSIGSVGDSLIVVCSKGILRIMGEPSDALGLNSTLTLTHLTADYGVNALTFCAPFHGGSIFLSSVGFVLVSSDWQVAYIGGPVVDETKGYSLISWALLSATQEIAFAMSSGKILIYNYRYDVWSTSNSRGTASVSNQIIGAYQGRLMSYNPTTCVVSVEDPTVCKFTTGTSFSVKTGWLHLNGLTGYQRIRSINILGEFKFGFTMTVTLSYPDGTSEVKTIVPLATTEPMQIRIKPQYQKQATIQVEISVSGAATHDSVRLHGLSIEYGALAKPTPHPTISK